MRLIDAEALKKDIAENSITLEGAWAIEVECAKALIDNAPTIEPTTVYEFKGCDNCELERPKGKWIKNPLQGLKDCSVCHYVSIESKNYCPNCGARMESDA